MGIRDIAFCDCISVLGIRDMAFCEEAHSVAWFTEDSRTSETIYRNKVKKVMCWEKLCGEEASCTPVRGMGVLIFIGALAVQRCVPAKTDGHFTLYTL